MIQLCGVIDKSLWALGDIARRRLKLSGRTPEKKWAIHRAVADLLGVDSRSLTEYREMSEFFPACVRDQFPVGTWHHFRQAKRAGSLARAILWLRRAMQSADQFGGKPMPVDVLAAKITARRDRIRGTAADAADATKLLNQLLDGLRRIQDREGFNAEIYLFAEKTTGEVVALINSVRRCMRPN